MMQGKKILLRFILVLQVILLVQPRAKASHIFGGEMTYRFEVMTSVNTAKYLITFKLFEDCVNPNPGAIDGDNPTHLIVFMDGIPISKFEVDADSTFSVPANFSNSCINNAPYTCLQERIFKKELELTTGRDYFIVFQQCCRNAAILNIRIPNKTGASFYCEIPPDLNLTTNSTPVFKNFPPQVICVNVPFVYDNSAYDIDGDSLSYELCSAYDAPGWDDTDPYAKTPPPYASVQYKPNFSAIKPIPGKPLIQVDPATGMITGTPNMVGRYVITICCHEWRNGVMINTIRRDFQFVVTDCSKAVVADIPQYSDEPNTYIVECHSYTVKFDNLSKGGFAYKWDFGVNNITTDTSSAFSPTYTYPDTGTYIVKLVVNPGTTCPDSITRFVKIYPFFHANFTDNGDCPNAPFMFKDSSYATTVYNALSWEWSFGDGDSSFVQNPTHIYSAGGSYHVVLISKNGKSCTDSATKQVNVEAFQPFAGNDTIIVKGEIINFDASGGGSYTWTPATNLNNPFIGNPTGTYPDTGLFVYVVHVVSPSQMCSGDDTISVYVVDHGSLYIPTAFSPNGDGLNDFFKPLAVGYSQINHFRVFNRWGQQVFYSEHLKEGWDGNYLGQPCELGTYFWMLEITDRFGNKEERKGDVTLLR
jgi:gliding motility-associated-like protein